MTGERPLPELVLAAHGGCAHLYDPAAAGIEPVPDASGAICAWWHPARPGRCLHLPGVGSFRPSPRAVTASPAAGVAPAALSAAYVRLALPLVLVELGRNLLHASAVETGAGVVGFCGRSGAGKSTLARAAARLGWARWADDALEFHSGAGGTVATWRLTGTGTAAAPLAGLFLLDRQPAMTGAAIEARPLHSADAFRALLSHAFAGDLGARARRLRLARSYLELVERVPLFALHYPSGSAHLPRVLAEVSARTRPSSSATTRRRPRRRQAGRPRVRCRARSARS